MKGGGVALQFDAHNEYPPFTAPQRKENNTLKERRWLHSRPVSNGAHVYMLATNNHVRAVRCEFAFSALVNLLSQEPLL